MVIPKCLYGQLMAQSFFFKQTGGMVIGKYGLCMLMDLIKNHLYGDGLVLHITTNKVFS